MNFYNAVLKAKKCCREESSTLLLLFCAIISALTKQSRQHHRQMEIHGAMKYDQSFRLQNRTFWRIMKANPLPNLNSLSSKEKCFTYNGKKA